MERKNMSTGRITFSIAVKSGEVFHLCTFNLQMRL